MATIITVIVFIRTQVEIKIRTRRNNHIRIRAHDRQIKSSFQESSCRTPVVQAGAETRSAMAFYVDLADYTASTDKAYADVEPTVCRLDE